jgi:DNA replication protein DnaC
MIESSLGEKLKAPLDGETKKILQELRLVRPDSSSNPCKLCGDSEYVLRNGSVTPCECFIQKKRREYAATIIPSRYSKADLTTIIPSRGITLSLDRQQRVIDLIKSSPLSGYVFLGPTGVGKTHLLYALVRYAIEYGSKVVAMTCSQFIKQCRDAEFNKEEISLLDQNVIANYTGVTAPLAGCLRVYLDELDKAKLSEYAQLLLFDLINSAYDYPDRIKITVTSNLPPQKFEEVYGAAFYRKLREVSTPIIYGA